MEKQTAVEWLESKFSEFETIYDSLPSGLYEYINQAKEMERQQIEDAWNDGNNRYSGIGDSETYYETLKKK